MGWFVGIANPEGEEDGHTGEELTKKELEEQYKDLAGLPMFDDHDYKKLIGRISSSWIDHGKLWILGKVNETSKWGKEAYEKIKAGTYGGLSLGTFGVRCDKTNAISDRIIAEASACPGQEGRRPGTRILLTLNSNTEAEQTVTMDMTPISNAQPLSIPGDVLFDAPAFMIRDVLQKAQSFLDEQLRNAQGFKDAAVSDATPNEHRESCKEPLERKINTTVSESEDVEMKEASNPSILS